MPVKSLSLNFELTFFEFQKGILRQYTLGQWLRTRYDGFLPKDYSSKDIKVYSTDVDRALMSAEANLAGLYPPTNSQIWEDGFLWEPIPVHLMATDDPVLTMNSECPKFDKLLNDLEKLDFFNNISAENANLFNDLSNYTGMNISLDNIGMIYSVFYAYREHNSSYIPSWADDIDLEKVAYLTGLEFSKPTFTEELRKLRAGPFLNYLIGHFDDVISNETDVAKFLMLSGHDSNLAVVLGGMEVFDFHPPEFASTVIWELRKNSKKEYYVNILHKKNSTDVLEQLTLNKCDFDCAFDDFKTNLAAVSVDSATWLEDCIISGSVQIVFSWSVLLMIVVIQIMA